MVDLQSPDFRSLQSNTSTFLAHIKDLLIAAERRSLPVLLRGSQDVLQENGFRLLEKLCSTQEFPISDALRTYEAGLDTWGQMRDTLDSEIQRLLDLLPPSKRDASIARFVRLATRHAAALESANLSHISLSSMFPEVHCRRLSRFLASNAYPPPYYRLFQDWREGRHYIFVSPRRSRIGVHIDSGGSYFFLRIHRGRKVVRLWPVYSRTSPSGLPPPPTGRNEIDSWLAAQRTQWPASVDPLVKFMGCLDPGDVEHPCEPFLPDRWRMGNATREVGSTRDPESEVGSHKRRLGHGADAHACFIEVDMHPGDELFVPSDTPHQVTAIEPTLSSSVNFFPG